GAGARPDPVLQAHQHPACHECASCHPRGVDGGPAGWLSALERRRGAAVRTTTRNHDMKRLGVIGLSTRLRRMLQEIDKFATRAKPVAAIVPAEERIRAPHPEVVEGVTIHDYVDRLLNEAGLDGVLIGTNC